MSFALSDKEDSNPAFSQCRVMVDKDSMIWYLETRLFKCRSRWAYIKTAFAQYIVSAMFRRRLRKFGPTFHGWVFISRCEDHQKGGTWGSRSGGHYSPDWLCYLWITPWQLPWKSWRDQTHDLGRWPHAHTTHRPWLCWCCTNVACCLDRDKAGLWSHMQAQTLKKLCTWNRPLL